jgi:signal transduction histidine kinase
VSPAQGHGRRLRVVEWFALTIGVLLVVAVAGVVAGLLSLSSLGDNRALLVDRLDPATTSALRLSAAMLNEETGVRGYALAGDRSFLEPYTRGRGEERAALADLTGRLRRGDQDLVGGVGGVRQAARTWRSQFAEPVIRDVDAGRRTFTPADQARGKALFDEVRSRLTRLQGDLVVRRRAARAELSRSASRVTAIFIAFGALLVVTVVAAALVLRGVVVVPLGRLAERVRSVSRGDFGQRVETGGAREVVAVGEDVDAMRRRIVEELEALAEARDELQRSNAELEQFAYVASHDLQEPLRKVASFTQMLARRYEGQLDERADQYIGFAVDGAKRMQELINDLLAFSRVGRMSEAFSDVDTAALVERARAALATRLEETGGRIEVEGELPVVQGEATLLGLVFQNLLANALKFVAEEPPRIRVDAAREADGWRFCVTDNGIGIEPRHAERIFKMFQRLHTREEYEGTGIGLSIARKIAWRHDGDITASGVEGEGAAFRLTLPLASAATAPDAGAHDLQHDSESERTAA